MSFVLEIIVCFLTFIYANRYTFDKNIDVGDTQQEYVRVCSYPSDKLSYSLGWLNILHVSSVKMIGV